MRVLMLCAVALFLLAGCSSSPAEVPAPTGQAREAKQLCVDKEFRPVECAPANATKRVPTTTVLNLTEDGMLVTTAGTCVFVVPTCQFQSTGGDKSAFSQAGIGNITGISITIEWTATTPATDTLALSVGLWPCETCTSGNYTDLGATKGMSPLTLTLGSVATPLDATNRIHLFVYNSKGTVYDPNVPGYAYATSDQAFKVKALTTVVN